MEAADEDIELIKLQCRRYVNERELRRQTPSVDTKFVGFRTVGDLHFFRASTIQCNENYAFIKAEDNFHAYVLKRSNERTFRSIDGAVFVLMKKIRYRDITSSGPIVLSNQHPLRENDIPA